MHACMDGWMDGCMYVRMYIYIYTLIYIYIYNIYIYIICLWDMIPIYKGHEFTSYIQWENFQMVAQLLPARCPPPLPPPIPLRRR